MMEWIVGRGKALGVAILIVVISLLLMTWHAARRFSPLPLEAPVLSLIAPLQTMVTWVQRGTVKVWEGYFYLVGVREENRRLQAELSSLRAEQGRRVELQARLQRLERLLGFKAQVPLEVMPAEVVGKDPGSWSKTVVINRGQGDGLRRGMAVVTEEGVVGQIIQVTPKYAKVLLITDARSAVDAVVQRTRSGGVVTGRSTDTCLLKYLPLGEELRVGDRIVSSGVGGIFPKGFPIGTIKRIGRDSRNLFQEGEVVPQVNFSRLAEVLIITSKVEGVTDDPPAPL